MYLSLLFIFSRGYGINFETSKNFVCYKKHYFIFFKLNNPCARILTSETSYNQFLCMKVVFSTLNITYMDCNSF